MQSLLDNDLYKFSMQQAVLKLYPNIHVTYGFTNRDSKMKFTKEAYDKLCGHIAGIL
jgi:nicotinate phosphoribosyltransferase